MINNSISIKKISDLLGFDFFIPSYQRGYRWTKRQVKELLNDIKEFSDVNKNTWYCLQPIVVKKNENKWDVVDGQQRLTTIYLILHYLNQQSEEDRIKPFELDFETREGSAHYLENELGKKEVDETNIDYFHISVAYQTIKEWFKENKVSEKFKSVFYEDIKIIWYEASSNEDSIEIFTRINSGKIPLTNAELIKALFLNSSNFVDSDEVMLGLIQREIASEWDRIEIALQDDSFWYFINGKDNNSATRIDFIFDLMYKTSAQKFGNDEYSTFFYINDEFKKIKENSIEEVKNYWKEVKKIYQALEEWYNDRELYHKIGYLIKRETDIKKIFENQKGKTKTEFSEWIEQEIKSKFKGVKLEEVEYGTKYVREILLFHNIQTMLNNENETNRFPFDRYGKEVWHIEHIHAIATEVNVKKEEQVEWLENNYVETDAHKDESKNDKINEIIKLKNPIEKAEFDILINYVLGEEDNGLQNLCLLDRGTNCSYKNNSFKEKRKEIIKKEKEGTFIPICTKNVFMKHYSNDVKGLEIWNEKDKKNYFEDIEKVLKKYLS